MFSCEYCEIFNNSFFYTALELKHFFSLWYIQLQNLWRKLNLMISSSAGSGHPRKYSYEIPHEYLKGWGNHSGKIISVNTSLIWFLFSWNSNYPLAHVATFSAQLYFGRSYFFKLFQSNYFDTTVTFSRQIFLQNSCFFPFFRTVTFSQELFFQNNFFFGVKLLQSRHYDSYFSEQLLYPEELFRIKISKKELIFQSRYFCTVSTFSEKIDFGKS